MLATANSEREPNRFNSLHLAKTIIKKFQTVSSLKLFNSTGNSADEKLISNFQEFQNAVWNIIYGY